MRIAINGFGRIGRCVLRAAIQREDCDALRFVAVNELASPRAIHYLTRYDTTHGRFPGTVALEGGHLVVTGRAGQHALAISNVQSPAGLQWRALAIDLLMECSGSASNEQDAQQFVEAGAARVLLSNPGETPIPVFVCGVNHAALDGQQPIVSAASCTSNALVPVLQVLHEAFGIENGIVTTVHASMHDQPVIDAYHSEDLRRNRAASQSIIPVDTQLAAGIGRVLPELEGRFAAHALRVPVNNVSALNITVNLLRDVDVEEVNRALQLAAEQSLQGILAVTCEQLASCDFNGDSHSGIIDASQTCVSGSRTANLLVWFDNEWAFANRMLDLALLMAKQLMAKQ